MLKNYLPFYEISAQLHGTMSRMVLIKSYELTEYSNELPEYKKLLADIQKACSEHGMTHTAKLAARATLRPPPETWGDIHHELTSLDDSLMTELEQEGIFRIDPGHTNYYEQEDAFGAEVAKAFPSCARDIRKAGSCYALEQEDACVHHLMLVLERGLYALAARVGVAFHRTNWQDVINNITGKLNHMPKGAERDVYTEVNAQFGFLKEAYRNHAEHIRDDPYDMAKARSIYDHVRSFMRQLEKGGLTE